MAEARVLISSGDHGAHLKAQVDAARQHGPVIVVNFQRTCDVWRKRLGAGEDLFFVDVTGHGPPGIAFGPDVHYVDSPVKLELVALVLNRVCKRLGAAHVILDDLGTACLVNDVGATLEFAHLLINRSRQAGCSLDLLLTESAPARLISGLRGLSVNLETLA